jgi:diguanylate cyclase (GGDEF)-like protein
MSQNPHSETRGLPLARPLADERSIDDLPLLLGAVTARLRRYAVEVPAAHSVVQPLALQPHDGVLDCVGALEQLCTKVTSSLERTQQSERELRDAQHKLARLSAELAGSRLGERHARHRALHDDLTALPNRACFRDRLEQTLLRATPTSPGVVVLFLDLDGFKLVNDRQGHGAGDQVLRIVAARLAGAVRTGDLVARLGGDEFGCLLVSTMSRDELCHLALKLLDTIGEPVQIADSRFVVRPSIGVAVYPADATSARDLLDHADAAMYRAKRLRSGYAFFDRVVDA